MPDWRREVRNRIQALRLKGSEEGDLVEEIAQHLEDTYRELRNAGAGAEKAYVSVLAELDDMYPLREQVKRNQRMKELDQPPVGDTRRANLLEDLWGDLRYAARTMRQSPLFVLFVVLTLALGIGANSTVFTLINTLILNPLPVPSSSTLLAVAAEDTRNAAKNSAPSPISYADLKDYETRNEVFLSLGGYTSPRLLTWQSDGAAQRMFAEFVTAGYFPALGIRPAKGRFFAPDEDGTPGAHPVAVINYGTWQSRFGGSADIPGKTIRLNNIEVTIVGVAPPQFIGINAIFGPDFWIPSAMAEQLLPGELGGARSDRAKTVFEGVGRLKPGVTRARAQADLAAIAATLARDYPDTNQDRTIAAQPIRDALFASANSGSAQIMFGSAVLLIVVGIVLLIACSNVANLLLARSAARRQEIAVRLAMGASRRRLIRQLLTESVLLGMLGGVVGLLAGYAALRLMWSSLPSSSNFIAPKFDTTVFLFAFLISLATGFLFGALPAFQSTGAGVSDALKEEARTTGRSRSKVSVASALLVGQVAFSFLLLVTAALFLRSIARAYQLDPGFQTAHLALFMTNPGQTGYQRPQTVAFYKEVRERVSRLPGVASVSWSSNLPLWARTVNQLEVEGREQRSRADRITAIVNIVDRNYFETSGVAVERGREFSGVDLENSTPVAIVNQKMAYDYWPAGDALGKRIRLPGEKQMRQIVGIARTANYTSWGEPPQPCVYVPLQQKFFDAMTLYVRSAEDPKAVLKPVVRETQAAGPGIVVSSVRTGREIVDGGLFQAKAGVALLSGFGVLALGLASVGLYGIMAYSVTRRRREIGLRMALGAARASVLRLILKQGMSLVAAGVGIGFAASLPVELLLRRLLFGVSASDPLSVATAAVVLLAAGLLACYLPARRASRVDPMIALREG